MKRLVHAALLCIAERFSC